MEVAPLQAQNLADPETQTLRDQNHRAVWFAQMLEQFEELVHAENPWTPHTLARILHAHQRDGILTHFDKAPSLGTPEGKVHNSSYVCFGLWSKWQFAQPQLHGHWLHLVEGVFSPTRPDVYPDVRQMRFPG
jgi:hypothetical protein